MTETPIHPVTGFSALGYTSRGPIWPVIGASEDHDGGDLGNQQQKSGKVDFTAEQQEVMNKIIQDRVARVKATPPEDYADLKQAAAELQKIRDGEKSDVQKLQDEVAKITAERDDALSEVAASNLKSLRSERAVKKGLPLELADRIVGTTEEEIDADIDLLLPLIAPKVSSPKPNRQQGNPSQSSTGSIQSGRERYAASKQ